MSRSPNEQRLIEEFSAGSKVPDTLKEFYRTKSKQNRAESQTRLSSLLKSRFRRIEGKKGVYLGWPQTRRTGAHVPLRGGPRHRNTPPPGPSPCSGSAGNTLGFATYDQGDGRGGYTYSPEESPLIGPIVAGYPVSSSLVVPKTGEFSLAAAVQTPDWGPQWPPQDPGLMIGGVGTVVSGSLWQGFFVPSLLTQQHPADIQASATLWANSVRPLLFAYVGPSIPTVPSAAAVYGLATITLYQGITLFPNQPPLPKVSGYVEFIRREATNDGVVTDISDLDDEGPLQLTTSMPCDGKSDFYSIEVDITILCVLGIDGSYEGASVDLRLVDDNKLMVYPDGSEQPNPIVALQMALCAQ